jgi:hypothetical protein
MAILNITYRGLSSDYPLDTSSPLTDADVRRIAVEVVRAGGLPGLQIANLAADAFEHFVVDRFDGADGPRIYLRPKVPFGSARA